MTIRVRAVVADDEPAAREELKYLLDRLGDVEVVGEAADGAAAVAAVARERPDVAFLDIRMPGPDGMSVARDIAALSPGTRVVFATAHDEYAVGAFALHAADYLLKPVDPDRLREAMARVRDGLRDREGPPARPERRRLVVERRRRTHLIDVDDVLWVRTDAGVVTVCTRNGTEYASQRTLRELEEDWRDGPLLRCHREVLVHLGRVASLAPAASGTYTVTLDDPAATALPVARNRVRRLKGALGLRPGLQAGRPDGWR